MSEVARPALFTLHEDPLSIPFVGATVAASPEEAAAKWGGVFRPMEGFPRTSVRSAELHLIDVVGQVHFPPDIFRPVDATDIALSSGYLPRGKVYTERGLVLVDPGDGVTLILRRSYRLAM